MNAPGELDLKSLLSGLKPALSPDHFVFVTVEPGNVPPGLNAQMRFQEAEGTTLILRRQEAQSAGLDYVFACRMITLTIHSSLEAVGMMAAVSAALANAGVSCNPVAGYHHDHIFVPLDEADLAQRVIANLAATSSLE